jgi:hypothetical protein
MIKGIKMEIVYLVSSLYVWIGRRKLYISVSNSGKKGEGCCCKKQGTSFSGKAFAGVTFNTVY